MIVNYKRKNILSVAGTTVRLLPGMNHNVNKDEFEKALVTHGLQDLVDQGVIEIIGGKTDPVADKPEGGTAADDAGETVPSFADLKQKDAVEVVKNTFDIAILEDLLDSEKRAAVKKAIREQIKSIQEKMKPADDEEGSKEA